VNPAIAELVRLLAEFAVADYLREYGHAAEENKKKETKACTSSGR